MSKFFLVFFLCLTPLCLNAGGNVKAGAIINIDDENDADRNPETAKEQAPPRIDDIDLNEAYREHTTILSEPPVIASLFEEVALAEYHKGCSYNVCEICKKNNQYYAQLKPHDCKDYSVICKTCVDNNRFRSRIVDPHQCQGLSCSTCKFNFTLRQFIKSHRCNARPCSKCKEDKKTIKKIVAHACREVNCPHCEEGFNAVGFGALDEYSRRQLGMVSKKFNEALKLYDRHVNPDNTPRNIYELSLPKIYANPQILERFSAVIIHQKTSSDKVSGSNTKPLTTEFLSPSTVHQDDNDEDLDLSHMRYMELDVDTYATAKILRNKVHRRAALHVTIAEQLTEQSMAPLLEDLDLQDCPLTSFASLSLYIDSVARALAFLDKIIDKVPEENYPRLYIHINENAEDFDVDFATLQQNDTDYYNLMELMQAYGERLTITSQGDVARHAHMGGWGTHSWRRASARVDVLKKLFTANDLLRDREKVLEICEGYQRSVLAQVIPLVLTYFTNNSSLSTKAQYAARLADLTEKKREEAAHVASTQYIKTFIFELLNLFNLEDLRDIATDLGRFVEAKGAYIGCSTEYKATDLEVRVALLRKSPRYLRPHILKLYDVLELYLEKNLNSFLGILDTVPVAERSGFCKTLPQYIEDRRLPYWNRFREIKRLASFAQHVPGNRCVELSELIRKYLRGMEPTEIAVTIAKLCGKNGKNFKATVKLAAKWREVSNQEELAAFIDDLCDQGDEEFKFRMEFIRKYNHLFGLRDIQESLLFIHKLEETERSSIISALEALPAAEKLGKGSDSLLVATKSLQGIDRAHREQVASHQDCDENVLYINIKVAEKIFQDHIDIRREDIREMLIALSGYLNCNTSDAFTLVLRSTKPENRIEVVKAVGHLSDPSVSLDGFKKRLNAVLGWPKDSRRKTALFVKSMLNQINSEVHWYREERDVSKFIFDYVIQSRDIPIILKIYISEQSKRYAIHRKSITEIAEDVVLRRLRENTGNCFTRTEIESALRVALGFSNSSTVYKAANRLTGFRVSDKYKTTSDLAQLYENLLKVVQIQKVIEDKGYKVNAKIIIEAFNHTKRLADLKFSLPLLREADLDFSDNPLSVLKKFGREISRTNRHWRQK